MLLPLASAATLLAALRAERIRLDRSRSSVPLRIEVTGTRAPCLVLPDGSVEKLRRRGPASILEQKALLHRAARLHAAAVVAEVMSIHAENHAMEGRQILRRQRPRVHGAPLRRGDGEAGVPPRSATRTSGPSAASGS